MKTPRLIAAASILCAVLTQAVSAQIEKHGWKLVFVTWLDETTGTEKNDKDYGRPDVVIYVKDYPYKVGQEHPKLLSVNLLGQQPVDSRDVGPHIRMTLEEFDCGRGLLRTVKTFWTDGSETQPNLVERTKWT